MRYAHDPSTSSLTLLKRASGSVTLGFLLALIGYKKKSLDLSGAVSASLVGRFDYLFRRSILLTYAFFFFSVVRGDEGTKRGEKTGRRAL